MKNQVLFSLKNNDKIFKPVVCCSRDWRLRGYIRVAYLGKQYYPKHSLVR